MDLGHEPYEDSTIKLRLSNKRDHFWFTQCPVPLITDRSQAFLELFLDCHSKEAGFSGAIYRQICWPTAQTLFEEHYLIVQVFRIIREELLAIDSEQSRD